MPFARLALLAVLAGLLVPVSGCLTCQPQLDVHHCRDDTGRCDLAGQTVDAWTPAEAQLFPDIERFVQSVPLGKHAHADWTTNQSDAFWTFHHVDPGAADKQVFLRAEVDGAPALFQVRVLAC